MAMVKLGIGEEPTEGNVKIKCILCGNEYSVPESEYNAVDGTGFVCPECVDVQNSDVNKQTAADVNQILGK